MEVIAMATLAAEAQPIIVSTVTQYTNVLAAAVVSAARVPDCRTRKVMNYGVFGWCIISLRLLGEIHM